MNEALQVVAARFTAARKAKKMTQQDVAEAAHVSTTTISKLENGHSMPQRKTRVAIARALGEDIFDDNLAEEASLGWPDDVQVFTKVFGQYLAGLAPEERADIVARWIREITGQRT